MPPSRARTKPKKPEPQRMQHLELMEAIIENPDFSRDHAEGKLGNVKFTRATINIRESAISMLAARKLLDPHQVQAAEKFRCLYEAMGGAGARAIDWRKEVVDGGRQRDPIDTLAFEAGLELKEARESLIREYGAKGWTLTRDICGDGRSMHDLFGTRRMRDTATDNLRACLDHLAGLWGYASKKTR